MGTRSRPRSRRSLQDPSGRELNDDRIKSQDIPRPTRWIPDLGLDQEKLHENSTTQYFRTCSSYHLHHVAGKAVALAEFEEFGQAYAQDIVSNAKALAESLQRVVLMCWRR